MTTSERQSLSYSEPSFEPLQEQGSATDEVSADATQLLGAASFNGVCRVIAALAENGFLSPEQLENMHDCMTPPLDDAGWRDDSFVSAARDTLEAVLATAMKEARSKWLKLERDGY